MKKIIVLIMAGLGLNLMAQMEQGGIDTLTIGSSTVYEVTPDPAIVAMSSMNASHFNWFFTDMSDNNISAGITITETPDGGSGYYTESTVNVTYDAATYTAGSDIKIKVQEYSMPQFGSGCLGSEEEIGVHFVAIPTVAVVGTSGGGCGITSHDIPLNITGYGPYDVSFTISYNGGPATAYTETIGAVSNKGGSIHNLNLTLTSATHLDSGAGAYSVAITNIVDRFSSKSNTAIAGTVGAANYTIGVNPVPVTQPIRHKQNLTP